MGARTLLVSNACGGMNPYMLPGDIMIMADHINLLGDNPLIALDEKTFGMLFVDMLDPYDPGLVALTEKVARAEGVTVRKGVYAAVPGPNLETRAEYVWLRTIGADAVGMSTVPEVLVARQQGVRCLGIACITDRCVPDELEPVNIERIIRTAMTAEPKFTRVVRKVIEQMKL
jgi:purine-nucleoside phosphorylase